MTNEHGCYHCLEVFDKSEIVAQASDGEVLCPICGIDSVIESTDREVLIARHKKAFLTFVDTEAT